MANEMIVNALLTEREVAKILGVCQRTVYSLRKAGKLLYVKIGGAIRYRLEAVLQYIRDMEGSDKEEAR